MGDAVLRYGDGRTIATAQGESFDLLLGGSTYDIFAGHWPKVDKDPITDGLNSATKYVVTYRPDSLGPDLIEPITIRLFCR